MSARRSARDRVRQELTREILEVARVQLARDGATGLSLRSVARELEMAPSALYRYFSSRDDLLSALILEAFESLADGAERAASSTDPARDPIATWTAVARSMRTWAVGHPREWALVFGSPVPGHAAPEATVVPYARLAGALAHPVLVADRKKRLHRPPAPRPEPVGLGPSLAPVADRLLPGLPVAVVARVVQAWCTLVGTISLEVFGHWRNTVLEPEIFFDAVVANLARDVGLDE